MSGAERCGVELRWLGQSGFTLRDPSGGPLAYIDPYLSPHEGRAWPAPIQPADLAKADLILCTHEHIDHFDQPALRTANQVKGAHFQLVLPTPIVDQALDLGIPRERITGAQPGETLEIAGIKVSPVPACHGVNMSDAYSFGREMSGGLVRFLGYVIEIAKARVYHAGDCIPYTGQVDLLKKLQPDLALLPINGRDFFRETERNLVGNMNPREAVHLAVDIGAQALVPMHWDLFPHNRGFPRDVTAYTEEFFPQLTLLIFGRGRRVIFQPARKEG